MQTTFKLIYGLPIKNKHLFVFLLFLLLTVLVFWRLLFPFFLFCFIFISNIFFFITVYLEKTICILLITYLLPKAIAFTVQPYNKNWTLLHIFFQGFWLQVQNSYFLEQLRVAEHHLWSKSVKYMWKSSLLTKLQTFILQL